METPTTPFYITGGTMPRNAPSYVERDADRELFEALRSGQYCYVLTSRQMGKSSLMVRTAARLREIGYAVVVLDLTAVGQNLNAEQWYDGLLNLLARSLDLEDALEAFWLKNRHLGPLQRWIQAIKDVVLVEITRPIVLFFEEIDATRSLPFSLDELFAAIRECYNLRAEDRKLNRLTFCFVGVATPIDLIRDTRITPFNIGRRIVLKDFLPEEAALFADGFRAEGVSLPPNPDSYIQRLLARVLYWTGGHPYLTQRLCRAIVDHLRHHPAEPQRANELVDRLCTELFLSPNVRERDDNLLFVRDRLLRSDIDTTGLLLLYRRVVLGERVPDDETDPLIRVLRLSGLVRVENGRLRVRNPIYAKVFDLVWIRSSIPAGEQHRTRQLSLYSSWRNTAVVGVLLLLIASFTGYTVLRMEQEKKAHERAVEQLQQLSEQIEDTGKQRDVLLRKALSGQLKLVDLLPSRTSARGLSGQSSTAPQWILERDSDSGADGQMTTLPDGTIRIVTKATGEHPWNVRAVLPLPMLRPDTSYILSFRARTTNACPITVRIQHDRPNWDELGLFTEPELSKEWRDYRWVFTTPPLTEPGHGSLVLGVGQHLGTVDLRDIRLATFTDPAPGASPSPAPTPQ